jgi:hypothetical protein
LRFAQHTALRLGQLIIRDLLSAISEAMIVNQ